MAAGLGYSRLACALLHWRAENPSNVLDAEVDALRQDSAGLTPLAWACAAGHADTAKILYRLASTIDPTRCHGLKGMKDETFVPSFDFADGTRWRYA